MVGMLEPFNYYNIANQGNLTNLENRIINRGMSRNIPTLNPKLIKQINNQYGLIARILTMQIDDSFANYRISCIDANEEEIKEITERFDVLYLKIMKALRLMSQFGCSIMILEGVGELSEQINLNDPVLYDELNIIACSRWALTYTTQTVNNDLSVRDFTDRHLKDFTYFSLFKNATEYYYFGHKIHKSRVIILNNQTASEKEDFGNYFDQYGGFGASNIDAMYPEVIRYINSINSINSIMQSAQVYTFKSNANLTEPQDKKIKEELKNLQTGNAITLSVDSELNQVVNSAGQYVKEFYENAIDSLALASNVPRSRLEQKDGSTASLNSTGSENEGERHYNQVLKKVQKQYSKYFQNILNLLVLSKYQDTNIKFIFDLNKEEIISDEKKAALDQTIMNMISTIKNLFGEEAAREYLKKQYNIEFQSTSSSLESDIQTNTKKPQSFFSQLKDKFSSNG